MANAEELHWCLRRHLARSSAPSSHRSSQEGSYQSAAVEITIQRRLGASFRVSYLIIFRSQPIG